jgi:putative hemolysin
MDGPGLVSIAVGVDVHLPLFDAVAWLQLAVLIGTLILCGIASAAETALTSVSRIKLKNLVEEGDPRAIQIEELLSEPNTFLSTILVVNSVAVIVASSMATVLALRFSATWGELVATILISFVVLIFCEITPKTAAVQSPLRWARTLVKPVRAAAWVLHPLVRSLSIITSLFVRMLGGQIKHKGPFVTEEELRLMVTVGEEEGVLEEEETEMIHSIFEFADTTVREVMVPRIDMITLASDMKVTEAVDLALQGGFSRIPVYEAEVGVDEIIGVLYTKDLLKQLREDHDSVQIRELVRPAYFDLLREIRQNRVHMVIVVDEYGSVAGLVTIEDLVEEIIGDIKDEYDREESLYEKISDDEYIFDAKISIYDFNDMMSKHLEDSDYETLGGFVYAQLDKIPVADDAVTFDDLIFTVLATRGRRITKIRVKRKHEEATLLLEGGKSEIRLLPAPKDHTEDGDPDDDPERVHSRGA